VVRVIRARVRVRREVAAGHAHARDGDAAAALQRPDHAEQALEQHGLLSRVEIGDRDRDRLRPGGRGAGDVMPRRRQAHLGRTPVGRVRSPRDEPLGLQRGDGVAHRGRRHPQLGGERADPERAASAHDRQHLPLRRRETAPSGLVPGVRAQREADLRERDGDAIGRRLRCLAERHRPNI